MVPLSAFRRFEALCSRLASIARNSGPSSGVGSSTITLAVAGGDVEANVGEGSKDGGAFVVDDARVGSSTGPLGKGIMITHS